MKKHFLFLNCILPFTLFSQTIIHYTETTGYNHNTASVSSDLFNAIANKHGWTVIDDNDGSKFTQNQLDAALVVVFSNTSGNQGLNTSQQQALEWFVNTKGGHLMGIHAATDTYRHSSANGNRTGSWDWYAETMGGSVQQSPNHTASNHVNTITEIESHPVLNRIATPWTKEEEYYYWENGYLSDKITPILQVGQTGNQSYDQARPVAWVREKGNGAKIFYTSLGHKKQNFTGASPEFETLLEDALLWMIGDATSIDGTLDQGSIDMKIFPNPVRVGESTTVRLEYDQATKAELAIFDLTGRKIQIHQNPTSTLTHKFECRLPNSGIFLLKAGNRVNKLWVR